MNITQSGNLFSFYFASLSEIASYNAWLDDIGLAHARVLVPPETPTGRKLRRILTKKPSILAAKDEDAVMAIKSRWALA